MYKTTYLVTQLNPRLTSSAPPPEKDELVPQPDPVPPGPSYNLEDVFVSDLGSGTLLFVWTWKRDTKNPFARALDLRP
jgi:hypothetical protein